MLSQLYRNVLLAWRRSFSRKTRNRITARWLAKAKALSADAEQMSPTPLAGPNPYMGQAWGNYTPPTDKPNGGTE